MADPNADPNADLAPIYDAMRKADAAGDADSVRKLATYLHTRTAAPAAEDAPAAPETPGIGRQFVNEGLDIAGTVARGAGTATGAVQNIGHMMHGEPTEDPRETGAAWAAPFANSGHPDIDEAIRATKPLQPIPDIVSKGIHAAVQSKPVQSALNTPAGQTLSEAGGAAGDVLSAAGTLYGGIKGGASLLGGARDLADTGIHAVTGPNAAESAALDSHPLIGQMRANGFKITGNDVTRAMPDAPNPGPTKTAPDTGFAIQQENRAHATELAAKDANLTNTKSIDPAEVADRMEQEGKVYAQVGDAVGRDHVATPVLGQDISTSGVKDADPHVQAKITQDVNFYRDHFKTGNFDGPEAVQTVRTLRNSASELANSEEPGAQARGKTYQNIANAIEDELGRQIPPSQEGLLQEFPKARQQLAKLHEITDTTEGGQVVPSKYLDLKKAGSPLSGGAAAIAQAADIAPESMSVPVNGEPSVITSVPHGMGFFRDVWNAGKKAVHALPGANPASDAYQASRYGAEGGAAATPPATVAPLKPTPAPPFQLTPGGTQEAAPAVPKQQEAFAKGEHPAFPEPSAAPEPAFEPHQPDLKNPPERTNTPQPMNRAEWDRAVLDTINRYKGEMPGREGPPVAQGPNLGTPGKTPKPPTPTMALRKKLGEAMQ